MRASSYKASRVSGGTSADGGWSDGRGCGGKEEWPSFFRRSITSLRNWVSDGSSLAAESTAAWMVCVTSDSGMERSREWTDKARILFAEFMAV